MIFLALDLYVKFKENKKNQYKSILENNIDNIIKYINPKLFGVITLDFIKYKTTLINLILVIIQFSIKIAIYK